MPQVPPGAAAGPLYPTTPLEDRVDYAPQINVRTDPNMFGANIAAAVQHLGGQLEKSSDELWQRAVAFKQLQNETEANKATMDTALKLGQQENAFKAKEGTNMIDAYKTYPQETQQIFEDQRAALSNPAAQRLYDQQTRRMVIQSQISAGGWAATAQKQVLDADNKAKIELAGQQAERDAADLNGYDPNTFKDHLNTAEQASRNYSDSRGLPQDAADNLAGKARSSIIYRSVKGMVKIDPARARDFLADNKDNMDPLDYENAKALVDGRFATTLARTSAANVHQGYMPWMTPSSRQFLETTKPQLQTLAKRAAQILDPNGSGEKSFQIISGQRSDAQQAEIWQRSDHGRLFAAAPPGYSNHRWGGAIDTVPGKNTSYAEVEKAFYQASQDTGVNLSGEHARLGARDRGHYSISKDQDFTNWQPPKPLPADQQVRIARNYTEAQLPDNDRVGDLTETRVLSHIRQSDAVTRETELQQQNDITDVLMHGGANGDPIAPGQWEELMNNPKAQQAWDDMGRMENGAIKQKQMEQQVWSYWAGVGRRFDPAEVDRIRGLANSPDPEHIQQFLDEPILGNSKLTQGQQKEFLGLQKRMRAGEDVSPKVPHAVSVLQSAGILTPEQKKDTTLMPQVQGILWREIQQYEKLYPGKYPNDEEIAKMGRGIMQQFPIERGSVGGFFAGMGILAGKESLLERDRPRIIELYKKRFGKEPSEEDVLNIFADGLFQDLYGKKK